MAHEYVEVDGISYPKFVYQSVIYPNNTVIICAKCKTAYWCNDQYIKEICLCGCKTRMANETENMVARRIHNAG